MGLFDELFETKKARKKTDIVVSRDSVSRATAGASNPWNGLGSISSKWDIDRAVTHAYERVIWVFRCVDAIASAASNIPIFMKEYDTEQGHKVEDKVLNKLLNRKTNSFEDSATFRYRLSSQLLLSTKGAFVELVRSGSGDVVEMYLLDPGTVKPLKDDRLYVKGFEVKRGNGGIDTLKPEQVLWIKNRAHPVDPYSQITPIVSSSLSIETDYLARIFNRNFLKNDGRPGMLIALKGDTTSEDAEEIKALFSGGYTVAGQTRVIEADGMDVIDLSARGKDVQWNDAIKNSKDEILLAFGVPESVLGNSSGRCLRASENVFLASGEIKRAEELVGQTFKLLQPSREDFVTVEATAEYAKRESIYKITTFSGRTLETNAKHPLFMAASVNKGPFKRDIFPWGWTELQNIENHFLNNDAKGNNIFTEVAVPVSADQLTQDEHDIDESFDLGSTGKEVPDYLFTSDLPTQKAFVSGLYSAHGLLSQHTSLDIYVPSRDYAIKLQCLLLRLGVHAIIGTKKFKHLVSVSGKINMFVFLSQLELAGPNKVKAQNVWDRLSAESSREQNAFRMDGLPPGLIWDRVYSVEEIGEDQTVAITILGTSSEKNYLSMFWEHNTFNNADSEEENFWTKVMKPHCESIARALEPLTNDDNDQRYIAFDYSTVDVLQRIERRKQDEIKQDFARGLLTGNQVLRVMGLPEVDIPYMNAYFHPNTKMAGITDEITAAVDALPVVNSQTGLGTGVATQNPFLNQNPTGGDGVVGGVNDLVQGQLAANNTGLDAQTIKDQAARTLRSSRTTGADIHSANPNAIVDVTQRIDQILGKKIEPHYEVKQINTTDDPHKELRLKMQGFIEGSLDSWSNRQLEVVKDRVNHVKVRKGTRHWEGEPGTKALDSDYIVDKDEWIKDAFTGIYAKVLELATIEANKVVNSLNDAGYDVKIDAPTISGLVYGSVDEISEAVRNQTDLVAHHIVVLDTSGKSIPEIQGTLTKEAFDRSRWSINLAKMVTTNVIEALYDEIYSRVDGKTFKMWCSGPNEHYRDGHGVAHGVKASVSDTFSINSTVMKYPGEGFGDEAIGCSCWLYYGIDK